LAGEGDGQTSGEEFPAIERPAGARAWERDTTRFFLHTFFVPSSLPNRLSTTYRGTHLSLSYAALPMHSSSCSNCNININNINKFDV
jgi:hypothetical protein